VLKAEIPKAMATAPTTAAMAIEMIFVLMPAMISANI
jgi:hypothetical protein